MSTSQSRRVRRTYTNRSEDRRVWLTSCTRTALPRGVKTKNIPRTRHRQHTTRKHHPFFLYKKYDVLMMYIVEEYKSCQRVGRFKFGLFLCYVLLSKLSLQTWHERWGPVVRRRISNMLSGNGCTWLIARFFFFFWTRSTVPSLTQHCRWLVVTFAVGK